MQERRINVIIANLSSLSVTKIAIVGDIHNHWNSVDEKILYDLNVDLVLFVGDLGNENVDLVRSIATLTLPKAIVLGNHDAWYTMTQWGRKKCPYDRSQDDRVTAQLALLGECHVGYDKLDFPEFNLTVVGSRPFSWGGPKWRDKTFYRQRYGIENFEASTQRIVAVGMTAACEQIVMIGHCGPKGLGDRPDDPCGKDWNPIGGDYGDPDFAAAIEALKQQGKRIPLVAFGHMHHHLRHTRKILRRCLVAGKDGTVYLNAARTPRIIETDGGICHNFSIVELAHDRICSTTCIWVNEQLKTISEEPLV